MLPKFSDVFPAEKSPILGEATYRAKAIEPLIRKLGKLFGKQFGSVFKALPPENFTRSDGVKGIGYRMLNSQGFQLRINFRGLNNAISDELSADAMFISGIDYWDNTNDNFNRATLNVTFNRDVNILQIYKRLLAAIKIGKKGTFKSTDLARSIDEATAIQKKRAEFLRSKGLRRAAAYGGAKKFNEYIKQQGVEEEWYAVIEPGAPEKNSIAEGLDSAQKKFDDLQFSDPETVFKDIEKLVKFLIGAKDARSLIICGQAGVGKTHHVTKVLREFGVQGKDYVYHGAMNVTPNSFFSTIAYERDKIICFDEADAILKDKDIQTMLKPMLDTSGDHRCEWSIQTAPMGLRQEEEIRNYMENVMSAASTGDVELVYARKATKLETNPLMYKRGGIYKIISRDDAKETEEETDLRDIISHILPDIDAFAEKLDGYLSDDYEAKTEYMGILNKAYEKFLGAPYEILNPKMDKDSEIPQVRWPSTFFFDGKIIFISNMRSNQIESAVLSRSIFVDVYLRSTDVRNRIKDVLMSDPSYDDVRPQLLDHINKMIASAEIANQTIEASYTNEALKRNNKELSIRYVRLAADMIRSKMEDWEEMAAKYC